MLLGDPTLSYPLSPVAEAPIPFFILERLREASQSGAGGMWVAGVSASRDGVEPTNAMALFSGLKKPPRDGADVARRVAGIAKAQVGAAFADSVLSAWQDVDRALALWPNVADTNHLLYPFYSVLGDRWLVRPLVPAPQMLTDEERAYYSKERHLSRNREHLDSFFVAEGTVNYKVDEFRWLVAIYEHMMKYMDRAVRTLEGRFAELEAAEDGVRDRFMLAYRRVAALRAIWRTQRNVLRCGSTIEYFTGSRKDEFWHVIRKDESYLEPGTHRRLFLEAMEDEIANAREIIRLVAESKETLIWTGDVEQSFVLPRDFTRQLEKKIEVMERHKADIDALFPGCPPETFTDPTYEWADKTLGKGQR